MAKTPTELILDRAHNAVVSMDERGVVTYWNPSAEATFRIPREQAIGAEVAELIIPERYRAAHRAGLRKYLEEGTGQIIDRRVEFTACRGDRVEIPVEMTISALREDSGVSFHAFIQDISERRKSEGERERVLADLQETLRGSERRFETVVGSLSDPVTIRDPDDHFVYANHAALEHLGFESLEALRQTPPDQIMADYQVSAADGSEVRMEDIPSVRIHRGEDAEPLLIRTIHRHTGVERWNLLKAAPLLDAGGRIEATIMIIEDVTERQRAERHAAFLTRAGDVLASSLDYEQTLRNVAWLMVPGLADWCAVDLFDRQGERQPVAVAHADPDRLRLAEQLRRYEPERPDPERGLGRVLRTGESLLFQQVTDEMLVETAVDERHLELLRAVGLRSGVIVPMRLGTRILGTMTIVNAESARVVDEFDLELAEQVAARAAVAIENSRLYSERSQIAHTLQQSLLPEQLPEIPGYELASAYIPALESGEVGGDFYDAWEVEGGWILVIGDVTGKGTDAAALTSLVRHTMRAVSEFEPGPADLLARVDGTLRRQRTYSICTALCIRLEEGRATLAVGGHPLPLLVDANGVRTVGQYGPLLGGFPDAHWEEVSFELEPGSSLVTYTDGVTDALGGEGERYGFDRLCATLGDCLECSAQEMIETLTSSLAEFQTGAQADDTAALVLRRRASHELMEDEGAFASRQISR